MSLNDISLDPRQLADWYGHKLVSVEPPVEMLDWPVLGDFQKKILILVDEPGQAFLSDEDLTFLSGILSACKMSLGDIGIININRTPGTRAAGLNQKFRPTAWWVFGLEPKKIGLSRENEAATASRFEGAPVFAAPSLQILSQKPEAKRELWKHLKAHYVD